MLSILLVLVSIHKEFSESFLKMKDNAICFGNAYELTNLLHVPTVAHYMGTNIERR